MDHAGSQRFHYRYAEVLLLKLQGLHPHPLKKQWRDAAKYGRLGVGGTQAVDFGRSPLLPGLEGELHASQRFHPERTGDWVLGEHNLECGCSVLKFMGALCFTLWYICSCFNIKIMWVFFPLPKHIYASGECATFILWLCPQGYRHPSLRSMELACNKTLCRWYKWFCRWIFNNMERNFNAREKGKVTKQYDPLGLKN